MTHEDTAIIYNNAQKFMIATGLIHILLRLHFFHCVMGDEINSIS